MSSTARHRGVPDRGGLVERSGQLASLDGWLSDVEAGGPGTLVLIAGEAGIGKTSLVERFMRDRARGLVLWGACDPLLTPAPLAPFAEIADELGGAPAELIERGAGPSAVARALLEELRRARYARGALLVLEDLHWADEGTLDVLRHLARRIERTAALTLVTYRDDAPGDAQTAWRAVGDLSTVPGVRRLKLEPLSLASVRQLARRTGADAAAIHQATGGNPFFVTEVLASGQSGVPGSVRDAVRARAARLDAAGRELLEAIALIPQAVELPLLERIAPTTFGQLDACVGIGMVSSDGRVASFRHELARLAIADLVPPVRRIDLHRAVLRELSQLVEAVEPARLAHHAEGAADPDAVLRYAPAAAARAASLGAHREAAAHYGQALAAAGNVLPDRRAELLEQRAWELYLTGRMTEATGACREAIALRSETGDRLREGDNWRRLSRFEWFGGANAVAHEAALEAVAVLEALPPSCELAMAYSNLSQLTMLAEDPDGAISWGERALALSERLEAEEIRIHALANIGTAKLNAGLDEGRVMLEDSLARAEAADLVDDVGRAFANLVSLSIMQRSHERAASYLERGLPYCRRHDLSYWPYLLAWQGRLELDSGDWEQARLTAAAVLEERDLTPPSRTVALLVQALIEMRCGTGRGKAPLAAALELAQATGELQRLAPVAAARAEAAWLARDSAAMLAAVDSAYELATSRPNPWWLGELAVWRRRAGEVVQLSVPVAEPFALELAGEPAQAAEAWTARGCPYEAAVALALVDDEQSLRRALAELQVLGATAAARLIARRLRERGVRNVPRGSYSSSKPNAADLTRRELDVLELMAEGLRNPEIAERLVLSPRTVDHHVSSILSKLGVSDRAKAVAAARRLGITE